MGCELLLCISQQTGWKENKQRESGSSSNAAVLVIKQRPAGLRGGRSAIRSLSSQSDQNCAATQLQRDSASMRQSVSTRPPAVTPGEVTALPVSSTREAGGWEAKGRFRLTRRRHDRKGESAERLKGRGQIRGGGAAGGRAFSCSHKPRNPRKPPASACSPTPVLGSLS